MDPEEMEEWRTIFNLFDVDGDESITCEVNIKTVQGRSPQICTVCHSVTSKNHKLNPLC